MNNNVTICVAILLMWCAAPGKAQWMPVNLPSCTLLHAYESIGPVLVTASDNGVYRSDDAGHTWKENDLVATDLRFLSLGRLGQMLFGGDRTRGGVYMSRDTGATWEWRSNGLLTAPAYTLPLVRSFAVVGSNIYAGTSDGVFESTDEGESWSNTSLGLTDRNVSCLAQLGRYLLAGTYGGGIFRRAAGSSSWSHLSPGPTDPSVSSLVADSGALYAGTWYGGVFISVDSGNSWQARNEGLQGLSVKALGHAGSVLVVGTDAGFSRSSDAGVTWSSGNSPVSITIVNGFFAYGGSVFAASDGCYVSEDQGTTWAYRNAGLATVSVRSMAVIDTCVFAGTSYPGVVVLQQHSAQVVRFDTSRTTMDARAIAGTATEQYAGLWGAGMRRSLSGGQTWANVSNGLQNQTVNTILLDNGRLMAGCLGAVSASTDHGDHWQSLGTGLAGRFVHTLFKSGSGLFVGTDSGVYAWSEADSTWGLRSTGLPPWEVLSLVNDGPTLYAGTNGRGVYRSSDGGMSWEGTNGPLTEQSTVAVLLNDGHRIIAGTWSGVFVSRDGGSSWDSVNAGLASRQVYSMCVAEDYVYSGTARGVYRIPRTAFGLTSVKHDGGSSLRGYVLDQNYPNPFNPSTTILYGLPSRSHVTLSVFNTLGQQVSNLVQAEQDAGYHEVKFDGADLPSGVYFYRMRVGSFTETRKLLLVR